MDRSIANPGSISAVPRVRAMALAAALSILVGALLTGFLTGGRGSAPLAPARNSGATSLAQLDPAAQLPISQAIGAAEPAYRAHATPGAVSLATPAQAMSANLTAAGVTVASGALRVGLDLTAAGSPRALTRTPQVAPTASGNRVLYQRGAVREWYVNGPAGIEQGFTVPSAPAGSGPLTLSLALSGNSHARLTPAGSIDFAGPGGSSLNYGELTATDALGHRLSSHLALSGGSVLISVDTHGARFPIRIDPLLQQGAAFSEGSEGLFGFSVALSADGTTALIGAPRTNAYGGGAWVFTLSESSNWEEQADLSGGSEASEACATSVEECSFGRAVALSADGNTAIIGAPRNDGNRGAALIYTRQGSTWTQTATLTGGEEEHDEGRLGKSVALSADGNTAIAGASSDLGGRGAAWVFENNGSSWVQAGPKLTGGEGSAHFGFSVAIFGNTAVVGAPSNEPRGEDTGAAFAFTKFAQGWTQPGQELTPTGAAAAHTKFGYSVGVAGETAVVGAPGYEGGVGAAYVFTQGEGGSFNATAPQILTGGSEEAGEGQFGTTVAISGDASAVLVGAPADAKRVGAAWLMTRSGSTFSQAGHKVEGGGEIAKGWFGSSVALSGDGMSALIGGSKDGTTTGAVWSFASIAHGPPEVSSIHPKSGPSRGGTLVSIRGSGFKLGSTVTIGSSASSVEVVSETELRARTSATEPGTYEVVVSDSSGASSEGPSFTYMASASKEGTIAPTVTSISPNSGPTTGDTEVTIHGTGFAAGATVSIGSLAGSVEVISPTEIRAATLPTAAGTYEVVVSDLNGTSAVGPTYTFTSGAVAATSGSGGSGVLGNQQVQLPPPVLAVSGNLKRVSGTIYVKLPGSKKFVLLGPEEQVPFGTVIDARKGRVQLTSAIPGGKTETITFYSGVFKLTQTRNGEVTATLWGGSFVGCPLVKKNALRASAAVKRLSGKHVVRKLWAEGHGHYTTKGSYASGAVLGTRWLTEDLCEGTLIHVATDKVAVTNLRTHHRAVVKAGHSLLVKAP
jgi:hypothetical protein